MAFPSAFIVHLWFLHAVTNRVIFTISTVGSSTIDKLARARKLIDHLLQRAKVFVNPLSTPGFLASLYKVAS